MLESWIYHDWSHHRYILTLPPHQTGLISKHTYHGAIYAGGHPRVRVIHTHNPFVVYLRIKIIVSQLVALTQRTQSLKCRSWQCLSQNICQVSFRRRVTNAYYIVRNSLRHKLIANINMFTTPCWTSLIFGNEDYRAVILPDYSRIALLESQRAKKRSQIPNLYLTSEHSVIYSASQLLNVTMLCSPLFQLTTP